MFTGIIEELGEAKRIDRKGLNLSIDIALAETTEDLKIGESIAVNGVCFTVVHVGKSFFTVDAVSETLKHTNIGSLKVKDKVNLERALRPSGRFAGHIVSGHIDGVGHIKKKIYRENSCEMVISFPEHLRKYIVKKGSIALDGVSLTIADGAGNSFRIAVIPHTLKMTTLGLKRIGDKVNIEVDILGKYIERALELKETESNERILKTALF